MNSSSTALVCFCKCAAMWSGWTGSLQVTACTLHTYMCYRLAQKAVFVCVCVLVTLYAWAVLVCAKKGGGCVTETMAWLFPWFGNM